MRACIETGAQQIFRRALPIWFSEEESHTYRFILGHVGRHGRLPALTTVREAGFSLPVAPEPPEFYSNRLADRAISTQVQHYYTGLTDSIRRLDTQGMIASVRAMQQATSAVAPSSGLTTFAEQAQLALDAHDAARRRTGLLGITLGWDILDTHTDGAQPGDLVVLVGRPGLGKTYLLLHQMRQAWLSGSSVFIASMEMPAMQIARRLLGMHGGVNPNLIRSGRLSTPSYQFICEMVDGLDNMPPIYIMTGNFHKSVEDVNRAIEELSPDAVYIDAGYLLTPEKMAKTRRETISEVMDDLKGVAINRNVPIHITVQFNRQVKRKQRGTPELGDIAESDTIAQNASIVVGVRYGIAPYERLTRILSLIKNREGDEVEFLVNYEMTPPNFDFRNIYVEGEQDTEPAQDMSIMT